MGLLDWITDGGGSLWSADAAKQPFVGATNGYGGPGGDAPPMAPPQQPPPMAPPQAPAQPPMTGDFDQNGLPPPGPGMPSAPPSAPMPQGTDPMTAGGAPGNGPGLPPPSPPMPQPRPAGAPPAPGAIPPPPPEQPPGAPMNLAPTDPNQPVKYPGMGLDAAKFPPPNESGFSPPNMRGGGGILSALGVGQDNANRMRGSVGAGLKAAGDSAGKSPMQALAGGAGSAMEGGQKASDTNNKQTIDYLNAAIKAKAAGDTASYNTNYTKYLAAKLKADTDKAASGNAKGDSPTQLYLSAVRATNSDPSLKGYNDAIRAARASGDTAAIAKAQADLETAKAGIMNGHLGRLKLDPQTAAQVAQQPGMNPGNAIDAGKQGITEKNIAEKLQPGQYYRNPKDGQIYQFNGGPAKSSTPDKPTTPTEPRDPNKPERGSRAAAPAADDEAEG